jgi:ribosomal protein L31E
MDPSSGTMFCTSRNDIGVARLFTLKGEADVPAIGELSRLSLRDAVAGRRCNYVRMKMNVEQVWVEKTLSLKVWSRSLFEQGSEGEPGFFVVITNVRTHRVLKRTASRLPKRIRSRIPVLHQCNDLSW